MDTNIISGYDFLVVEDMSHSSSRIISYSRNMSESALNNDHKTTDAICYNLYVLGSHASGLSSVFKERFNKIDWQSLSIINIGGYLSFPQEMLHDILHNKENGLLKEMKLIPKFNVTSEIYNYMYSIDFLNYKMTLDKFIIWIKKEGKLFFDTWVFVWKKEMNDNSDYNVNSLSKKQIINAWEYYDSNAGDQNSKIFISSNITISRFSINEFRIALEIIFSKNNAETIQILKNITRQKFKTVLK